MATKFDVATPKGLGAFNGFISSKSYVEGFSFSKADLDMFGKFSGAPSKDTAAHAYRWYAHIAAIQGVRSLMTGGTAAAATPSAKKAADDDDVDDLFDDDEEEEKPKAGSRAEKIAAAKAEKEKKAKPEKVQKTQIVFEVKPWDTEIDLLAVYKKVQEQKCMEGMQWGEAAQLVPVAYGIKKLVCSCVVVDDLVGVDDCTDVLESFEDEVQSVEMTTMNRL